VDSKATGVIFAQLKRFIVKLLHDSTALLLVRSSEGRRAVSITTAQVMHMLNSDEDLTSVISPAILTKYSSFSV
jgi:hypothetical protein